MKSKILPLAFFAALLSSCTTSYKTGQTPDDVYFSPSRAQDEYVRIDKKEERRYRNNDDEYYDDRYLRMKVRNRYLWSELEDPYYYSRRYSNNYAMYNMGCYNNPWTPSLYWNNHYNPYYQSGVVSNPKTATYSGPRTFNLNAYNNNALTNNNYSNPKLTGFSNSGNNNTYYTPRNNNYDTRRNDNAGGFLRDIFKSSGNNSSGNTNSSSGNSSSGSSGSSSSGSSTAPVRKF